MGRKKKVKLKNVSGLLTGSLLSDFLTLDPIAFVESVMTIEGKSFELTKCGRDYLHEIYRYICLEAVSPNGAPCIIKKGRQVEMTTTACAISLYFACSGVYDHIRGLHVFPQIAQAQRHSKLAFDLRVQESVNGALYKLAEGEGSVASKAFKNSNFLLIEGAGEEGDRLRGIPLDYLLLDEAQDIPQIARDNTLEALSHSKFGPPGTGLVMDFGTPKGTNSHFHDLWLKSDRRYYHLKCPHCGLYVPIWYEYDAAKNIKSNFIEGFMVRCETQDGRGCGKLMDKRKAVKNGKWIPTGEKDAKRRGYHIDQLLVPHITRESIDAKLHGGMTARAFANEVMGEFYTGRDVGLSYAQVVDLTTQNPDTRKWRFNISVQDKMTWAGVDWGAQVTGEEDEGKGGYTVFVVLSRLPENKFRLEFAERMSQSNIAVGDNSQIEQIAKWIRQYNCKFVGVDHGFGRVQNEMLLDQFPDKIKPVFSTAGCKQIYKYDPTTKQITIDKHQAFEELYDLVEQGVFCFPYDDGTRERVEWLMEHIANVEIITKALTNGSIQKRYIKQSATKPIDGLCALVYAYIAYKFQSSSGFKNLIGPAFNGARNMPKPGGATMRPLARSGGQSGRMARVGSRRW